MTIWAKLVAVGGGILVMLSLLVFIGLYLRNEGRQSAIRDIAERDQGAINAVEKVRDSLSACRAGGGVWDRSEGTCDYQSRVQTVPPAGGGAPGR